MKRLNARKLTATQRLTALTTGGEALTTNPTNGFYTQSHLLYCIVFEYLYSAPQQPWANRGAFDSISSKKRDKF